MKSMLRRSALLGMAAGLVAIVVVILVAMFGPAAAGGSGESLMGASILLTQIGAPLSLAVVQFADAVGAHSPLFPLTYVFLFVTILIEWSAAGLFAG